MPHVATMANARVDHGDLSTQLRTAGLLNFALAKPCHRHDAFSILCRGTAVPSPQPGKQYKSRIQSSPGHDALAGSSEWSMSCLPGTWSQQQGVCSCEDEEAVIAEFLSSRQHSLKQALNSTGELSPATSPASSSRRKQAISWQVDYNNPSSASSAGRSSAGSLSAGGFRAQKTASTCGGQGMSQAAGNTSHKASAPTAIVQWDSNARNASQGVEQLLTSCNSDYMGSRCSRRHGNSLRSQHAAAAASGRAARKQQHRSAPVQSSRAQCADTYISALRKRQAGHAKMVLERAMQQQAGAPNSSATALADPQSRYKALLHRAFVQHPQGHRCIQKPETQRVSRSSNSSRQQSIAARTPFGVHADKMQRAQQQAAVQPGTAGGSSSSALCQRQNTCNSIAPAGKAVLFAALHAVTAANQRAAAALSAAARQAKAAVSTHPSLALSDNALVRMVTGWYRTAEDDDSEHASPIGTSKHYPRRDHQQQQVEAVATAVAMEPSSSSSSSTWSDSYPCSARCMCGVGYSRVGRRPSQELKQLLSEQVCDVNPQQAAPCGQQRQPGSQQQKAGDKAITLTVVAGVEQLPLQGLAAASSIIDELQHG